MRKNLEYYYQLKYPVIIYPESEGGFVAQVLDLPGCITQGETITEVWELIEDARKAWLEVAYIAGDDIPLPYAKRQNYPIAL